MGIRHISSYLKQHGHPVDLFFCPQYADELYSTTQLESILEKISERRQELIGISCSTEMSKRRIVQLVNELKKLKPRPFILLGGHAATFTPEQALKYVDAVCIGEGEEPTLSLVERLGNDDDIFSIPNLWFNSPHGIIRNQIIPSPNLDHFPTLDYGFLGDRLGKYFRINGGDKLIEISDPNESLPDIDRITTEYNDPLFNERESVLFLVTSRGCVYQCAYCQSPNLNELLGSIKIKKRSIDLVIEDIKKIKQSHPDIDKVSIWDDDFFIRSISEIKEFSRRYKEEIKLPLFVYASPKTFNEEKLRLLADAARIELNLGIQSGSKNILREIYNRKQTIEEVIKATRVISEYASKGLIELPWYDFIVNNPWARPEEIKEDIRLVQQLPKPYSLHVHSLELLPNSALYLRAVKEGKIKSEWDFKERLSGLMATSELQDFTEHINELTVGEHAYFTLIMYCLAGPNIGQMRGSIPDERINELLDGPNEKNREAIINYFFQNIRVQHYIQERLEKTGVSREKIHSEIERTLRYKF